MGFDTIEINLVLLRVITFMLGWVFWVYYILLELQGPTGPFNSSSCGGLARFAHENARFARKYVLSLIYLNPNQTISFHLNFSLVRYIHITQYYF